MLVDLYGKFEMFELGNLGHLAINDRRAKPHKGPLNIQQFLLNILKFVICLFYFLRVWVVIPCI